MILSYLLMLLLSSSISFLTFLSHPLNCWERSINFTSYNCGSVYFFPFQLCKLFASHILALLLFLLFLCWGCMFSCMFVSIMFIIVLYLNHLFDYCFKPFSGDSNTSIISVLPFLIWVEKLLVLCMINDFFNETWTFWVLYYEILALI